MITLAKMFSPRPVRKTIAMKLPIVIITEEDYEAALVRLRELEFDLGEMEDEAEFVAITEAMLRYEMQNSVYADHN